MSGRRPNSKFRVMGERRRIWLGQLRRYTSNPGLLRMNSSIDSRYWVRRQAIALPGRPVHRPRSMLLMDERPERYPSLPFKSQRERVRDQTNHRQHATCLSSTATALREALLANDGFCKLRPATLGTKRPLPNRHSAGLIILDDIEVRVSFGSDLGNLIQDWLRKCEWF